MEQFSSGIEQSGNRRSLTVSQIKAVINGSYKNALELKKSTFSGPGASEWERMTEAKYSVKEGYDLYRPYYRISVTPGEKRGNSTITVDFAHPYYDHPIAQKIGDNLIEAVRLSYWGLANRRKYLENEKYEERKRAREAMMRLAANTHTVMTA